MYILHGVVGLACKKTDGLSLKRGGLVHYATLQYHYLCVWPPHTHSTPQGGRLMIQPIAVQCNQLRIEGELLWPGSLGGRILF